MELYQSRNGSQRIQNELKEKIANTNRQLTELLNYETERNQQIPENQKAIVDYDLLNKASHIAMSFGDGWDDLSFVNEMILALQLEITKETDEMKQKNIDMISDTYFIQKKVLIEELVEHDEEMIKKGEVMIDNDTGETTILSNKKQRQEEINELK